MNRLILLLFLAPPCFLACHQVKEFDNETYIVFTLNDTLADSINWQHEDMRAEFQLRGNKPLRYALHPVSDTITQLSCWVAGKWKLQENIYTSGWIYTRVVKDSVKSYFKITDFDNDGDQDLTCWIDSDAHTNRWTIVFINDEKQHKLVKLINSAEHNWDALNDPRYDPKTGIIHTELYSGAYGVQNTATYKLKETAILPVFKEETDLSDHDNVVHNTYVEENGKWKLIKKD